ncbi:uroporphyrinogen-III C-methyltransferase [Methylophaga lonarensis]|uniref:uroporphyrinogen-III C-methyltransferase n=1 Tax=Methylophaga lonarensis TaxID=999151 RepID=UPI003D2BE7E8
MENASKTDSKQDEVKDAEIIRETSASSSGNKGLKIFIIVVLLLLLLHAVSFVFWWQQGQQIRNIESQLPAIETLNDRAERLSDQLESQQTSMQAQQKQLDSVQEQLTELAAQQSLTNADIRLRWALAEMEYLLNMANQRALLSQDVRGARTALDLVDKILEQTPDYRLLPLRELIAEEELAMAAVREVDIAGIAVELQSAIDRVEKLRVVSGPQVISTSVQLLDPEMEKTSDWRHAATEIWQQLRSLVVIRHQQDGESAVLVPEQRYFLYQNLKLQLQTARFALLSGQADVFSDSIKTAQQWLERYFVGDERDAVLDLLTELEAEYRVAEIPDISASLRWIQGFKP